MSNDEEGLEYILSTSGENLAVGQQQLLCLARALIQKSKVIVLDEATSNVDNATDALIQRAIHLRSSENGSSVITIAHRIHTIVTHDMVMVMGEGDIIEFGRTEDLLQDETSEFAKMAKASGIPVGKDRASKRGEEIN